MNHSPSLKRDDRQVQNRQSSSSSSSSTLEQATRTPAVSIRETGEALLLEVDLPGVKPDQLQLSVNQGVLTLQAPVAAPNREGFQLLYREYDESGFRRAFTLPDDVDPQGISAQARNGVVTITLPKSKESQPRRIAVTAE